MVFCGRCVLTFLKYRQLKKFNRALKEKRPEYAQRYDNVIFQHNNAQPHVTNCIKNYMEHVKWNFPKIQNHSY